MKFSYLRPFAFICGLLIPSAAAHAAPARVVFSKEVLPVLNRECGSCHRGSAAPGGYSLESAEQLLGGGRHGKAVVPGKSADSTLVKYLTGQLKPQMPPGKPLPLDTVAIIRRWIDEGAKIDGMVAPAEKVGIMRDAMPMKGAQPNSKSTAGGPHAALLPDAVSQSAPVTALAYSPDGKLLAAGGYRAVRLLDPATGTVQQTLSGPADQVLSLAWSSDGKYLAAAGGPSGVGGEVCVWLAAPPSDTWAKPRLLKDHSDAIYSVAWRPGTTELATGSLDKTAKIWDAATGQVKRTLKDHVDAVFSVAYSPDGKWLATGSTDRTLKLYQADTGTRVSSFSHNDGVTAVAFSAKSDLVIAAADKQLRVWPVKAGTVENPLRGHGEGEAILGVAFSADGSTFAWGAANRRVRLWNGEVSNHRREMADCPDWVYSVALSPDGKTVTGGGGDGKVYAWKTDDGKLLYSAVVGGGLSRVAAEPKK